MKGFLTPKELSKRWPGIAMGTLANWRMSPPKGPQFQKMGWSVIYIVASVEDFERANPWVLQKPRRARGL